MLIFNDENKFSWRILLQTCCTIIVAIFLLFGILLLSGKTLISSSDALNQHVQIFAKFHEYLVTFLQHPKLFGTWDWTLSNGTDWYSAFSYYILGDPLGYLMIFFDAQHTIIGYQTIVLIRYTLAGISVVYFATKFGIPNKWIPIIVMTYLSCLFGIYGVLNQSLFLNAMIYLPLLIVGVEKYFATHSFKLLVVSVALTVASNFYWGIILGEIVAIYAIVTYIFNHKNRQWIRTWGGLIGFVLLGILIASGVLLPMVIYLLNSPRNGSGFKELFSIYPIEYYLKLLTLPFGMLGVTQPSSFWLQGTASAVNTLGFIWIWINRQQNRTAFTLLMIILGLLLIPAAAVILTIGNVPTNRWMFAYYLLTAVLGVHLLTQKGNLSKKQLNQIKYWLIFGTSFYLILANINQISIPQQVGYLATLTLMVGYLFTNYLFFSSKYIPIVIFIAIVATVCAQLYLPINRQQVLPMLSDKAVTEIIKHPTGLEKDYANDILARTAFANGSRTENNAMFINTFLTNAHATGLYLSTANPAMIDFSSKLAILSGRTVNPICNLDNRFLLTNYFGANQIVSSNGNKAVTYPGLVKRASVGHLNLYHNEYAFPVMWQTNLLYKQKYFEHANPVEKENLLGLGQLAIPGNNNSKPKIQGLERIKLDSYLNQAIETKLEKNKSIKVVRKKVTPLQVGNKTTKVIITSRASVIKLRLPRVIPKGELMLYLNDVHFTPPSLTSKVNQQPTLSWRQKYLYQNDGFTLTANTGERKVDFEQLSTASGAFYQLRQSGVFNFGIPRKMPKEITLSFNKPGTYTFNVQVYNQRLNAPILKQIKSVQLNSLRDIKPNYHGISGVITSPGNSWIGTNIPYSKGWSATVGEKAVPITKVNADFVGINVKNAQGQKLRLIYQTPGLLIGYLLAGCGIVLFSLLIVRQRTR